MVYRQNIGLEQEYLLKKKVSNNFVNWEIVYDNFAISSKIVSYWVLYHYNFFQTYAINDCWNLEDF